MKIRNVIRTAALLAALVLLLSLASAESWQAAEENIPKFSSMLDLLRTTDGGMEDRAATDKILAGIRTVSEADYHVGRAIADHWYSTVLNEAYRLCLWQGEEKALTLEESNPDFSGKHAFVVLGYQLQDGEMTAELTGRCGAAAAAARSYPEAILICTGGATGSNNPLGHTEAGMMKDYLVRVCGIEAGRIFTEPEAMTTLENAVNSFRIMKEEGVGSFTLVTSDYHQLWAQVLYNAMAAAEELGGGDPIRMTGNYNYPAPSASPRSGSGRAGLSQLSALLRRKIDIGP